MKRRIFILSVLLALSIACSHNADSSSPEREDTGENTQSNTAESNESNDSHPVVESQTNQDFAKVEPVSTNAERRSACFAVDTGDRQILKSQTYPIDFEPFEDSCFVTTYDPEYTDLPLGSAFSIYKNGKQVYEFESRFNPDAVNCHVTDVDFEDLTDDGLIDVIILGKCGTTPDEMQGNEVFINDGNAFVTAIEINDKLDDFKTSEEIANFVRKNKDLFTPEQ